MMHVDKFGQKIEGYWKSAQDNSLPMPVRDELTQTEADMIADLIVEKEKNNRPTLYRGMSPSRIDGSWVGCGEYTSGEWSWPAGFGEHYVRKYRVRPSEQFLQFIGYQQ